MTGSAAEESHDVTWFVDRSLGRGVARALIDVGEHAIYHDEQFPQDALDEEWLPLCGERGWVVLTKDKAIRRRLLERQALLSAGVRAFFLTSGSMTGAEMAGAFLRCLPAMSQLIENEDAPFIALVSRSGVKIHVQPSPTRRRR